MALLQGEDHLSGETISRDKPGTVKPKWRLATVV
jgi:hypothetical protein